MAVFIKDLDLIYEVEMNQNKAKRIQGSRKKAKVKVRLSGLMISEFADNLV